VYKEVAKQREERTRERENERTRETTIAISFQV